MKNAVSKILGIAVSVMLTTTASFAEAESSDPIKITLHDWTGQLLTTNLMAEVLKKGGYNVELVQADYIAQFTGLKTGDLHVALAGTGEFCGRGILPVLPAQPG